MKNVLVNFLLVAFFFCCTNSERRGYTRPTCRCAILSLDNVLCNDVKDFVIHAEIKHPSKPLNGTLNDSYRICILQIFKLRPGVTLKTGCAILDVPKAGSGCDFGILPNKSDYFFSGSIVKLENQTKAKILNLQRIEANYCLNYWSEGDTDDIFTLTQHSKLIDGSYVPDCPSSDLTPA